MKRYIEMANDCAVLARQATDLHREFLKQRGYGDVDGLDHALTKALRDLDAAIENVRRLLVVAAVDSNELVESPKKCPVCLNSGERVVDGVRSPCPCGAGVCG